MPNPTRFAYLGLLCLAWLLGACGQQLKEPVAFELYAGDAALPPPHQGLSVIQGVVQPELIQLTYRTSDGQGEESGEMVLRGEEREQCLQLLRRTKLKPTREQAEGAGAFEVTLTDASGKQLVGVPSNRGEWAAFARQVANRREASQAPAL
ncbi:hypothetical protein [Hymenobacter latericus]|uniref:hypothetical protein n=1 Tax=Hymenobacter sp. YIM 151858-1 TaxID=2987688 RepID=UPI0022272E1C|nr:hypothetical protein [Hymenobacter sp. YIM 151858-1]UYZ59397.1 hypothetical protein OIS50_01020 [Hymenobacter sp. YIM 151858-1]